MRISSKGLLIDALKHAAGALKQADVPFALAGKFAVHARGGPLSEHDVDFLIREEDAPRVLELLVKEGFRAEKPPEDWLVKVYEGDRLVDLIFRPSDKQVTDKMLADIDELPVYGVRIPVLSATQLMINTISTLSENYCDFARGLPTARTLREQIDWPRVVRETGDSPYAYSFLVLLDRLGVAALAEAGGELPRLAREA